MSEKTERLKKMVRLAGLETEKALKKSTIRRAGLRTEKQFFGPRGIFAKAGHTGHLQGARFPVVSCSQCGKEFGPGDHGFSHCSDHRKMTKNPITVVGNPLRKSKPEWYYDAGMRSYILDLKGSVYILSPTGDGFKYSLSVGGDIIHYSKTFPEIELAMDAIDHGQGKKFKRPPGIYGSTRLKPNPITVVGNPEPFTLLSHGIYAVSDKTAGDLARHSKAGTLPRVGREIRVSLPSGKEAWLTRQSLTMLDPIKNKRGWVWAVHHFSQAGGDAIPFGKSYGPNPPARINTTVAGVLYNRCLEIRAEKTSASKLKGLYYHPFLERSKVCVLALDNGDILIHSQAGEKLWKLH